MTQAQIDGNKRGAIKRTRHGYGKRGIKTPRLYKIWQAMRDRCYGINNKAYTKYGGAGVTVCDEWIKFENFRDWSIENGYNELMHLDKDELCKKYDIEPKIYSPKTCQWIMQHKNNIIENSINNIDTEIKIVNDYKAGSTITELAKIYYNGNGKSNSAPTKYIEELLKRYGVYNKRLNKTPISNETIKSILSSKTPINQELKKHNISKSKWYRAKKRYEQQRNHNE